MSALTVLQLSLLGGFQVSLGSRPPPRFQTNKVRALLAYLAVEVERPHERARLVGLLWPEMPERKALNNLSKALGLLRRALNQQEGASPYLLIDRQVVRFNPDSTYRLDMADFQRQTAASATIPELVEAVALYQGEFLAGFSLPDAPAFEEWLLLWRERLHQQMLAALDRLTTHFLEMGDSKQAQEYARRQLELDAWRESAHAQLMHALALAGDRSGALTQFESCRQLLAEELGVAPTAETLALYEAIKTGQVTPFKQQGPALHNFPAPQTPFVGRQRELDALDEQMRQPGARLVTVIGPGGQGKTRLTLAYAERALVDVATMFPDGLYFISLAGLEPTLETPAAEHLIQAIAARLPLTLDASGGGDARPPKQQLLDYLSQKRLLLLLDNLDPFLTPAGLAAGLVGEILDAAPDIRVLVTARERLGLYGESVVPLSGLSLPAPGIETPDELGQADAVQLFIQAACRVQPDFQPQADEWPSLGQLCHYLGGLPLAVELAASWTEMLLVTDILADLRRDLSLLSTDLEGVPPRHRSVRRVLEHTWHHLAAGEQQVLAALSVFRGGFTRDAVQAVALPEETAQPAALRLLRGLVQKSLLVYDRARDRYGMHELLGQFAREQLALDVELETAMLNRHSAHYCAMLQVGATALWDDRQQMALDELEAELENVRWAWRHAVIQRDVPRIAAALEGLFHFLDMRSRFREGARLFQGAAEALTNESPTHEQTITLARLQARAGWFVFHLGRPEEAAALLQDSLARLQQHEAEKASIFNLNYLGAIYRHQGAYELADHTLNEALRLAQAHDDPFQTSISLNILGQTASLQGDYAAARRHCQEALRLKREIGDLRGMTYSLTYLGRVALAQQDYEEAQRLFQESLAISKRLGDQRGMAFAARNLGNAAQAQAGYQEAERWYEEALTISRQVGNRLEAGLTLIRWGEVVTTDGDLETGRRYLREGVQEVLAVESEPGILEGLFALAQYGLKTGQLSEALEYLAVITHAPRANPELQARVQHLAATTGKIFPEDYPPERDLVSFVKASLLKLT